MQIELLETGSPDCPLIRLYGVELQYFSSLHDEVLRLAANTERNCPVHEIRGFQARSDCRLTLFSSLKDENVRRLGPGPDFAWRLSSANWSVVAGLIEPFCTGISEGTYQWLSGRQALWPRSRGHFRIAELLDRRPLVVDQSSSLQSLPAAP